MIALGVIVARLVIQLFTLGAHVELDVMEPGNFEWYGGICELRVVELEINATWYETRPIDCGKMRR